jgi:hypothetical protein
MTPTPAVEDEKKGVERRETKQDVVDLVVTAWKGKGAVPIKIETVLISDDREHFYWRTMANNRKILCRAIIEDERFATLPLADFRVQQYRGPILRADRPLGDMQGGCTPSDPCAGDMGRRSAPLQCYWILVHARAPPVMLSKAEPCIAVHATDEEEVPVPYVPKSVDEDKCSTKLVSDQKETVCGAPVKEAFRFCETHQRAFGFLSNEDSEQLQDDKRKLHEEDCDSDSDSASDEESDESVEGESDDD